MAQCMKCQQKPAVSEQSIPPVSEGTVRKASATYSQPVVQRHTHPIPSKDGSALRLYPDQQTALLRALEHQNALLTDLLSAVNGLTALICSKKTP